MIITISIPFIGMVHFIFIDYIWIYVVRLILQITLESEIDFITNGQDKKNQQKHSHAHRLERISSKLAIEMTATRHSRSVARTNHMKKIYGGKEISMKRERKITATNAIDNYSIPNEQHI